LQIPRLRSGFRHAAQFLACPEQVSRAKLPNGPRKRLKLLPLGGSIINYAADAIRWD